MTKKCPKCGNEFDAELTTCPTCGYSLTDTTVDKEEAETTSTNIDFETQENDKSELKRGYGTVTGSIKE